MLITGRVSGTDAAGNYTMHPHQGTELIILENSKNRNDISSGMIVRCLHIRRGNRNGLYFTSDYDVIHHGAFAANALSREQREAEKVREWLRS